MVQLMGPRPGGPLEQERVGCCLPARHIALDVSLVTFKGAPFNFKVLKLSLESLNVGTANAPSGIASPAPRASWDRPPPNHTR